MADTADDLSAPLGQKSLRRKRRFRLPFTGFQALAVLLGLFLVTFAGFAIFTDNPLGGEPIARVAIHQGKAGGEAAPAHGTEHGTKAAPKEGGKDSAAGEQKTVTIIDGSSGARHSVVVGDGDAAKDDGNAAPAVMAGINEKLLEKSRYGM